MGISKIKGLISEDVETTINSLRKLGIKITRKKGIDYVHGVGISGFKQYKGILQFFNIKNSKILGVYLYT